MTFYFKYFQILINVSLKDSFLSWYVDLTPFGAKSCGLLINFPKYR